MRKQTAPRTRKHLTASSNQTLGLIAKAQKPMHSARGKNVLDNRSHRTIALIERGECEEAEHAGMALASGSPLVSNRSSRALH